jgi:multidrug efflux pump subunit AcrA (membrane-fusion protein)
MAAPNGGALTSELSLLLSRVAAYDALVAERDGLLKSLGATSEALREAESRAVGYSPLADERDALLAEARSLRAQLAMAEDETRRTKPMRDALVRELQARGKSTHTRSAMHPPHVRGNSGLARNCCAHEPRRAAARGRCAHCTHATYAKHAHTPPPC